MRFNRKINSFKANESLFVMINVPEKRKERLSQEYKFLDFAM